MLTCSDNLYETLPNFLCCAETVFCLHVHPPELIVLTVLVFFFFFFFLQEKKGFTIENNTVLRTTYVKYLGGSPSNKDTRMGLDLHEV